jgi:ABC-type uncharacterized transport system auxiliary subunit
MDSGSKLQLEEWIPTEYDEKQTLRAVRKRSQIPSQREEKKYTINDFPKASEARQVLRDPTFKEIKKQLSLSWRDQIVLIMKDRLAQTNQNVDLP